MNQNHFGQIIGAELPHWQSALRPQPDDLPGNFCHLVPVDSDKHEISLYQAYHMAADTSDWTYFYCERPESEADFQQYLQTLINAKDAFHYTVVEAQSAVALGTVGLQRIDEKNGVIEIGSVNWSPRLKRHSAGTEAIYLLLHYVFDKLGYRRCEWKCDSLNGPSNAAAIRFGFQYEGQFRQAIVTKGRNRDTNWYAITDREWPLIKQAFNDWLARDNFDNEGKQKTRLQDLRISR
ncbi:MULTISPECIES: GNAT family N-acetyltransferase [Yersinia]|uniref:Acetyltransferase family protein n=1 Tax=Yersinia rochesterensis TaxID=1604335 RepID=A0A386HE10_9GAMM|nr:MULTISPECIES: GNAT family protein [Yersinia]AJI87387.1 acetyltransferase family protein [Yersinia frederiksenii Y225]CNH47227.1 putative acetyltransferase [Yersinia kristensenii]AIN19279.1 acetyltransferase family protein [Yersinia rochesterensis]AJJ35025.1 acetyltransferase family protein [Yersinia rochesterensis]AYD43846.1 N-acetyltransferase [Yersinia rochesterensis]